MNADKYQPAWQVDLPQGSVAVDMDVLRKEVQRDQESFREAIFWRDCGEVGVTLLLLPLWFFLGAMTSSPWTWYLTVPVLIWIAGFTLVYRKLHKQKPSAPDEPLLHCVNNSLTGVEAQIWLLRNVFWWYLLPFSLSLMAFFAHVFWMASSAWWEFFVAFLFSAFFLVVLYGSVYFRNQRAVRVQLEPRRQDLLKLAASLEDGTTASGTDGGVVLPVLSLAGAGLQTPSVSPVRMAIGMIAFAAIMLLVFVVIQVLAGKADSLPGGAVDSPSQPEFDDISAFGDSDISRVDAWLEQQVELAKYPSLSVAIVRDDETVYQGAFGFEDIRAGRKATPQTLYNVASVTKAFTATLAVILHDRGVIDLDQPVVKYLPADVSISTTPDVGATITLRQLASHTSGLPRGVPGRVQSVEGWYHLEPQRLYAHLASVTLNCDPGKNEAYSNLGFGLLGHALECAADKPLDRVLQEMLCTPLQLERTAIQADDKLRPATGYDSSGWRFESSHSFRERLAGSGGLVTSVEDLAKFMAAQMKPSVFSSEMLEQLHTASVLADGHWAHTSLGWTVRSNVYVGPFLEKNGGRNNCSAWIGFATKYGVGVAVATNCGGPDVDPIGRWLLERSVPGAYRPVGKFGFARVAPYTGVRWENDLPIVQVQGKWSRLASIDVISVDRIMEFAHNEFGDRARKRFTEDLVFLLSKMGHEPEWSITLGLQASDGQVEELQIRMTEENRDLLRK